MSEKKTSQDRVLLVYPANHEQDRADRPPLGLLTVAAPLVQKGYQVAILDERVEEAFDERLRAELAKNPICVGISSMSGRHIKSALRISRLVKQHTQLPVVWGGVQASLCPDATILHEMVDIIVRDDGEEIFPELLQELKKATPELRNIRGIGFKENGVPVLNPLAPPVNMEALPVIPFFLLDLKKYIAREPWMDQTQLLPMETSRGCPFSCTFCTESVRKKKWRALSPERVIKDLKHYIETYGIHNFTFIDDNIFGDVKRGRRLIESMAQANLGIRWYSNARTDFISKITPSFLTTLEQSGCRMLTFGAESGSERVLEMIQKKATAEQVIQANRLLARSQIHAHFVTIAGFPGETIQDVIKTYLMNATLLIENTQAICDNPFLIPTPSTIICEQTLKDKASSYTLEDWSNIFDLRGQDEAPQWLSVETFKFIKDNLIFDRFVSRANRSRHSKLKNWLIRYALIWFRKWYQYKQRSFVEPSVSVLSSKATHK